MPYKNNEERKLYAQKHYQLNKDKYRSSHKETWRKTKEIINELKSNPCTDCGVSYPPYVMHFDHLDGKTKIGNVNLLRRTKGRQAALDEIKKCELVCANCHLIRTYKRAVGIKLL